MPRIIDCHVHRLDDTDVAWARELGYDKVCLMDHELDVLEAAVRKHPDFVIPLGWLPLHDRTKVALHAIERFQDIGCLGLKICGARARYDDESFYPVYEKAQEYGLPVFFHTGWLDQRILQQTYPTGIRMLADWYHPITLDRITLDFPALKLVAFHMGGAWMRTAGLLMRQHANVYADSCTGFEPYEHFRAEMGGEAACLQTLAKMVYGTDGMASRDAMKQRIERFQGMLDALQVPAGLQDRIWHGNALHILGLDDELKKKLHLAAEPVAVDDFVSRGKGRFGEPALAKTSCTVVREGDGLRFTFTCADDHADRLVLSPEGPVDAIWQDDSVEVFISPANDQHYVHLVVNALGRASVQRDRDHIDELPDADEARITSDGWTVSLAVSFDLIGCSPARGDTWGLQLCRNKQTDPAETISWMEVATTYRDPSSFGKLIFE
ncbi:MAG TPA: amidohydrolase family protein [Planctomycetota bacterium]|nr:amidohydrolase family protein [Planctomycetota bacterium]